MTRHYSKPTKEMVKNWKAAREWFRERFSLLNGIGFNKKLFFKAGLDRRNAREWSPAWLHCWQQPGLKVEIGDDGTLYFTWPRSQRGFRTMAVRLPESIRRKKVDKKKYINLTQLKKRGWTIKLIEDFKPTHDATAPNPINPDWAPQKLYRLETIQEIERDEYFQRRKRWANWFQGHMKKLYWERKETQNS